MLVLSNNHLKLNLGVFLTVSVAMVTYYVKRTTMTYLTMIWHLFDTIIICIN